MNYELLHSNETTRYRRTIPTPQPRNLARTAALRYYRPRPEKLEGILKKIRSLFRLGLHSEVRAMLPDSDSRCEEGFEISPRFRHTLEDRIARLESDAECDEAVIARLDNKDHVRRQRRLVAAERAEALRMRIFLDRARTREPWTANREQEPFNP